MAKPAKSARSDAASVRVASQQVPRLERRLAVVRELENKRRRQAARARDGHGPRALVLKRQRQLEKARRRSAAIEAEIATQTAAAAASGASATAATAAAVDGPQGYCMRERRKVTIANPEPMVMRNGRMAVSGTCASCGARVVRL